MTTFEDWVFIILILFVSYQTEALVELPEVEENVILETESKIRLATNELFSTLKLKGKKDKPRLQRYSLVHNYLVSRTLHDYYNLKQIAKLTRVDKKNISNVTENFIALINEIFDDDIKNLLFEQNNINRELVSDDINNYIDDRVTNFNYLKQNYGSSNVDINSEVLRILKSEDSLCDGTSGTSYDKVPNENEVLDEPETWMPSGRRIYQGKRSKIRRFPFMASVQFFSKFQCASSIVKYDLAITAASCLQLAFNNRFFRENPAFLSVRVGSDFYDEGGDVVPIMEVYFHPNYSPHNLRHNLAIMRLARQLHLKRPRVKKIDIDTQDSPMASNSDRITIVGWGAKTHSNIIHSPWENKISFDILDIYSFKDCQDIYTKEYVTNTNFCAGFVSKGGGACNRDIGGPGVAHGVLVGVVSFGSPVCGTPDSPTVFTKLGYYADWIEEIMEKDTPWVKKKSTAKPTTDFIPPVYQNHETTFLIEPIGELSPISFFDIPTTTTEETLISKRERTPKLNDIKNGNLFKQFLKTMFESDEIEEYFDNINENANEEKTNKNDKEHRNIEIMNISKTRKTSIAPLRGININLKIDTTLAFRTVPIEIDEELKAQTEMPQLDHISDYSDAESDENASGLLIENESDTYSQGTKITDGKDLNIYHKYKFKKDYEQTQNTKNSAGKSKLKHQKILQQSIHYEPISKKPQIVLKKKSLKSLKGKPRESVQTSFQNVLKYPHNNYSKKPLTKTSNIIHVDAVTKDNVDLSFLDRVAKNEIEKSILSLLDDAHLQKIVEMAESSKKQIQRKLPQRSQVNLNRNYFNDSLLNLMYLSENEIVTDGVEVLDGQDENDKNNNRQKLINKDKSGASDSDGSGFDDSSDVDDEKGEIINDDKDGLAIAKSRFKDFTYRQTNHSNLADVISQESLLDILAEAVAARTAIPQKL